MNFDIATEYLKLRRSEIRKNVKTEEKKEEIQKTKLMYCPLCGSYSLFDLEEVREFDGHLYFVWRCRACLLRGDTPYKFEEVREGGDKN